MNNWVELLPTAEYVLLKRDSEIIKSFLFQALYGYHPEENKLLEKGSLLEEV